VIVVLLEPASRSGDLVSFRAQAGRGLGYWRGSVAQPVDSEVDVEIDVGKYSANPWDLGLPPAADQGGRQAPPRDHRILTDVAVGVDWSDIEILDEPMTFMAIRNREMEIEGPVSDLNEDGVLSLRLGDGELRLDTTGQPPTRQPLGVRVILAAVDIYPTCT
jgi:hypothetical protein